MKILFSIAVMVSVLLSAQPILFTSSVAAQAYGGDVYGGSRYNGSPSDNETGDTSDSGTTPSSSRESNNIANTTEARDEPNELQQDSTPIDEGNNSHDDEKLDLSDDGESGEQRQNGARSASTVNWIALWALVAALVLFVAAIVRKRRKK